MILIYQNRMSYFFASRCMGREQNMLPRGQRSVALTWTAISTIGSKSWLHSKRQTRRIFHVRSQEFEPLHAA